MPVAPARAASTVVLIRPSARRFEVLLVKRHDNVAFMGGAHVFPGGRVDESDRFDAPERVCEGFGEASARMPDIDRAAAVALHVAGIRELLEEAGVLLARPVDAHGVGRLRREMAAGATLEALALRDGFRLALDSLHVFAHWVTPEVETKRFDTRFFIALLPPEQEPMHDEHETTDSEWMEPDVAVERCRRDEILLPPPTWTTLRMLSKLSTADEAIDWARRRRVVRVQPGFIRTATETMLTLPGHSTFPPIDGFETPEETRFVLEGGRWRASR
jgi:8-oxo-dGTP pyrophosphatase MutT (NUDIX family)